MGLRTISVLRSPKGPASARTFLRPSDVPYLGYQDPTPQDEIEVFHQTWFFFGLLAEFYSLNQLEDGSRLTDATLGTSSWNLSTSTLWSTEMGGNISAAPTFLSPKNRRNLSYLYGNAQSEKRLST